MKTVLCFGDSNTFGTPPMAGLGEEARFDRATRWPGVMAAALGPGWHVVEEGHPGRTTVHDDPIEGAHRNGARILPALLESHRPLDAMVLMLGTNDHKQRFGLTTQDIALGAGRLADMAIASGRVPTLLLVCPPGVLERGCLAEMFTGAEARGARLADAMADIAGARGLGFLDAGAVVDSDPLDGVHLSAAAHRRLGAAIADALRDL